MIKKYRKIVTFCLIALATSLLCMGLYFFNNKYTHNDLQPQRGHLTLSEEALSDYHYLINDWEFYPNVLLSPADLSSSDMAYDMFYTDIGEHTRFNISGNGSSPHGYGTYVLQLKLPETAMFYSLEMPEIFSAYRLYINDELYMQIGNPEPDNYEARTQAKLVNFQASGTVRIMVSVSDYSHFYSGMVYAPVFGESSLIISYRDLRQCVSLVTITLGAVMMFLSLYLGLRTKQKNALLFSLLSFVMFLIIGFPYLHTLVELPVYPWYALELICIYLMPVLVIILHNQICDTTNLTRKVSTGIATAFFVIAGCYGLAAPLLTVEMMRTFSTLVFLFKLGMAFYLLTTSFMYMNSEDIHIQPLYYASIFYAMFFLWDRILPSYEPIFYGWFGDWANLILVMGIGYSLLRSIITSYTNSLAFAEENRQINRQLKMQNEYARMLSEQSENQRRLIHDFRQHMRTISVLANRMNGTSNVSGTCDELIEYTNHLSDYSCQFAPNHIKIFSKNAAVDALLQYYDSYAAKHQIETNFQMLPLNTTLTDVEMCTVLGNLLENAIEACQQLPEHAARSICLHVKETEHRLFILIENTYNGIIEKKGYRFRSLKTNSAYCGIGIESVRDIVKRHGGTLDIYPMERIFRVGISLPV